MIQLNLKTVIPYDKEITESSIKNVPKMNLFADENLNSRYQQANKDLLARAKEENTGIEISAVYNEKMEQIGGYTVGKEGSVTIENPDVNYHGFHNHPSGETFSIDDILKFCQKNRMVSITAIGNNSNCYNFSANEKSDRDGYKLFLEEKLEQPLFGNYTYQMIKGFDAEKLGAEMELELKDIITKFTEECIERGQNYGFKYTFTRLAD